jgi:carbon monoxide dehydrogenase subunit G
LPPASASDSRKFDIHSEETLQFQKEVEIAAPREKVWSFIWDVDQFIACVPGCREAKTLEAGKRYAAVIVEKVGPFKVEFPMTVEVLEREEHERIKAQASGSDNKIGSRMKVDLDVNLRESGDKTLLGFVAGVDILGKLAALGHSIIKRKADQVLDEFAQAVKKRLEGAAQDA